MSAANEDILLPGKIINQRWKVEKRLGKSYIPSSSTNYFVLGKGMCSGV